MANRPRAQAATAQVGQCDEVNDKCIKVSATKGVPCSDGDSCTTVDTCVDGGKCVGVSPKKCQGDVCNAGTCDPKTGACGKKALADNTGCNDGNACTSPDGCKSGKCVGGKAKVCANNQCNLGVCNTASGACGLKPKSAGTSCSDGKDCTVNDLCQAGVCKPGEYTCECAVDADCKDNNECTNNKCQLSSGKKVCQFPPKTNATCNDKKACTSGDKCNSKGTCVGQAKKCNDSKTCTNDFCDAKNGKCVFQPQANKTCNDNDPCTTGDKCDNKGGCGGTKTPCNDGNVCTNDSCASGKCVFNANSLTCDDGNECTVGDKCANKKCTTKPKNCNDSNYCTTDTCSSGTCKHAAANAGKTCGSNKVCSGTSCTCRIGLNQKGSNIHEMLYGVAATHTNGAIAVGRRQKSGVGYEGYCRSTGGFVNTWKDSIVGATTKDDQLRDVVAIGKSKNVYLAVGDRFASNSSGTQYGWLVKFDANCKQLGNKTFKYDKHDQYFRGVAREGGGGAWVVGSERDFKISGMPPKSKWSWRGWVIHVDVNMKQLGGHIKIGGTKKNTHLDDVAVLPDQRVFVVGRSNDNSNKGSVDGAYALLNKSGSVAWWKRYGTTATDYFWATAIEGPYAWMVGLTEASKSSKGQQRWLVKVNWSSGQVFVDKKPGGNLDEWASDIAINSKNLRVLTGRARSSDSPHPRGQIMLMNSSGDLYKFKDAAKPPGLAHWDGVTFLNDGRIVVAGEIYDTGTKKQNPWLGYLSETLETGCK